MANKNIITDYYRSCVFVPACLHLCVRCAYGAGGAADLKYCDVIADPLVELGPSQMPPTAGSGDAPDYGGTLSHQAAGRSTHDAGVRAADVLPDGRGIDVESEGGHDGREASV